MARVNKTGAADGHAILTESRATCLTFLLSDDYYLAKTTTFSRHGIDLGSVPPSIPSILISKNGHSLDKTIALMMIRIEKNRLPHGIKMDKRQPPDVGTRMSRHSDFERIDKAPLHKLSKGEKR
jgi:hypothetical protein